MNTEQISQELRALGISPTHPRVVVLDYIRQHRTHPTIDTIYHDLLPEYPGLSRTTVYNTLHLFVQKSLCQAITIDDRQVCYDGDITSHGHFLCTSCGHIHDLFGDQFYPHQVPQMPGYDIHQVQYYYKGICPQCKDLSKLV